MGLLIVVAILEIIILFFAAVELLCEEFSAISFCFEVLGCLEVGLSLSQLCQMEQFMKDEMEISTRRLQLMVVEGKFLRKYFLRPDQHSKAVNKSIYSGRPRVIACVRAF